MNADAVHRVHIHVDDFDETSTVVYEALITPFAQ